MACVPAPPTMLSFLLPLVLLHPSPVPASAAGAQSVAVVEHPAAERHAPERPVTDRAHVRHLLNRAGFGATGAEIEHGVALGLERLVDRLLAAEGPWQDIEPELFRWEDFGLDHMQVTLASSPYFARSADEQIDMCKDARVVDRNQFLDLYQRWFTSMVRADDPLRDRMTLFWHGYFTTSWEVVKRKYELVHQFQWLRRGALSSYADFLHGIVRDPAMLQFLDQTASSEAHPNENLAREWLELFSLGEGHYTEVDVREAARALTGNVCTSEGGFAFLEEAHDAGEKTILGATGAFGDRELVDVLMAQEACPRWVARRILRWIEGVEPEARRIDLYATLLRRERFELRPFLRALFLDPEFYREEVVGTRVLSPIEYLAFACHKLEIEPNGHFLNKAGVILGQVFYWPPSVKGWPEGLDWITNDALLRRGNLVGALLGVLRVAPTGSADDASEGFHVAGLPDLETLIRTLDGAAWEPSDAFVTRLLSCGARTDADVAEWLLEEWLPGPPASGTHGIVSAALTRERELRGIRGEVWLHRPDLRTILLRQLAHLVFSLPEAHLS